MATHTIGSPLYFLAMLVILTACATFDSQADFSTPYVAAWQSDGIHLPLATRLPVAITVPPTPTAPATVPPTATLVPLEAPTNTVVAQPTTPRVAAVCQSNRATVLVQVIWNAQPLSNAEVNVQDGKVILAEDQRTDAQGLTLFCLPANTHVYFLARAPWTIGWYGYAGEIEDVTPSAGNSMTVSLEVTTPRYTFPPQDATVPLSNAVFRWDPHTRGSAWLFRWWNSSEGEVPINLHQQVLPGSTTSFTPPLEAGQCFFWDVSGLDAGGATVLIGYRQQMCVTP